VVALVLWAQVTRAPSSDPWRGGLAVVLPLILLSVTIASLVHAARARVWVWVVLILLAPGFGVTMYWVWLFFVRRRAPA